MYKFLHMRIALVALHTGKLLFVEKTSTDADAAGLNDVARQAEKSLTVKDHLILTSGNLLVSHCLYLKILYE